MKLLLASLFAVLVNLLVGCATQGAPSAPSSSGKVEVFGDIDAGVSVRR